MRIPFAVLLAASCVMAFAQPPVRVWEDRVALPTYREGPPDPNPPFDVFRSQASAFMIYPYSARTNYTTDVSSQEWRRLNIENEYLVCGVLPDLGGRLSGCRDKRSGREMFFSNTAIRPQSIGPRGAWVALGIELNFPVAHSRTTVSPVQYALRTAPDGAAAIALSAVDQRTGMEWRVEYWLRPGVALLEQRVTFYNRSDVRHAYQWWNNAAVRLDDPGMLFVYPMHAATVHGSGQLESWPVSSAGVDLSVASHHRAGLGLFALGSREPFFGAYLPRTRTAILHYAAVNEVPGKKLWTWGSDGDAYVRKSLTDDGSTYVELQAGVFRDQGMFGFLDPEQTRHFTEYWIPACDLGGVDRANPNGVLHLERGKRVAGRPVFTLELNAARPAPGSTIRLLDGPSELLVVHTDLAPGHTFTREISPPPAHPVIVEWLDAAGRQLMRHVEGSFDADSFAQAKAAYRPPAPNARQSEQDYWNAGQDNELTDQLDFARNDYARGLQQFPNSARLLEAAGRLAVALGRYNEAVQLLQAAREHGAAGAEVAYHLGLARAGLEDEAGARKEWEAALDDPRLGTAARLQWAMSAARSADRAAALKTLAGLPPDRTRASEARVALLAPDDPAAARRVLQAALEGSPADPFLRVAAARLIRDEPALWGQLARDPNFVLDIAAQYLDLNLFSDAVDLLSRDYPALPANQREAGVPVPQQNPLLLYYRAYARNRLGLPGDDLRAAAALPVNYVFPYRPEDFRVLRFAAAAQAGDASAHYLLGCLYLQRRMSDKSIDEWQKAVKLNASLPTVAHDLGRALIAARPGDPDTLAALQASAGKPVAGAGVPSIAAAAPALSDGPLDRALGLAAGGDIDRALALFSPANFPAEKQPPEVRRGYLEVQVQRIVQAARAKRCAEVEKLLWNLGAEDRELPFTLSGFDTFIKTNRTQYYLGVAEAACGDEKAARKRWSKIARQRRGAEDPVEVVFGLLAARKTDPSSPAAALETAVENLRAALARASGPSQGDLLYAQGVLLRSTGKDAEAIDSFRRGAQTASGFGRYLNLEALGNPVP